MKLIPFLKDLARHKRWVALAPVFAALILVGIAKKLPSKEQYTATKQVLVDSASSAVPDASKNLAQLVPRAGMFAQIMTNTDVMNLIGKAAGIPGDEIAASGPANTFGQSATHPATVASAGGYALSLTQPNASLQPIISITAQATTRAKAAALAQGGALGLTQYVNELAKTYNVSANHRVSIRDLGAPSVSNASSGIPKAALPIVFLLSVAGWCVLVVFAVRFIRAWRTSDHFPSHQFPTGYDAALLAGEISSSDLPAANGTMIPNRNGASQLRRVPDPDELEDDAPVWSDDDSTRASVTDGRSFAADLFSSRRTP